MAEFIRFHYPKIQFGAVIATAVSVIWATAVYAKQVDINTEKLSNWDSLATKQDLQELKEDIKYFINNN